MTISDRLRSAMKHAKIPSQAALSRESGVPQPTINRILQGKGTSGPELATVVKLANACRVRSEWLMSGNGSMLPSGADESKIAEQPAWPAGLPQFERGIKAGRMDPRLLSALGVISEREAQVLAWFRMALEPGKLVIETAARAVEKKALSPIVNNQPQPFEPEAGTGTNGLTGERE